MTVYEEIRAERRRQRHSEGFGDEHDDEHTDGSLAAAAACYAWGPPGKLGGPCAFEGLAHQEQIGGALPWPNSWHEQWDKRLKHPRRRQLVIAAALCVAEIQRLDRAGGRNEPFTAAAWDGCARQEDRSWHIVELYGHRRLAGQVSQASFPEGFIQINTVQGPTQIYNPKAVFSLAPVTEQAARAAAAKCCDEPVPIKPWESGEQQRIEALRAVLKEFAQGEAGRSDAVEALQADDAASGEAADRDSTEPPDSDALDDEDL